jgi:hypothetical protein
MELFELSLIFSIVFELGQYGPVVAFALLVLIRPRSLNLAQAAIN